MNILKTQIDITKLPQHIAIIMDGNGRWAKQKGKLRVFGHESGAGTLRNIIQATAELGIPYLTLYAFSTENWNRPKAEVNALMSLLFRGLQKEIKMLHQNNIRLNAIGDMDSLPTNVQKELQKSIELTQHNTRCTITLALAYGSRQELIQAVKKIASDVKNNIISLDDIDELRINQELYTRKMPNVDLLIRTSGEHRISNFLLWQIAYAELYFTKVLWPDFTPEHLYQAIINFQQRERRFGKTSEQLSK
ncbi:isoprenyl transferase [Capnocytophaga catalasegens]|uniref:isoprenyl transferase n=1 Tax=Capnocytophaga catalasegens TaxID=1004260 RepID=UPI00222F9229|nr:isoprenyl transferase [Capnocytophaga catalasegens]